ncbi:MULTISPECIES: helix-turn-helix transcriptional regulator [Kitasatospora]|uniref:Putative DNA-binding protein n=1 Tax=Kitasatospora setae (strain ATCC 33774 / DSM 43861 / JCM 3304 / KCC A-0304 / NBRC 14216 / KM-6054) TaxID=452652 RepID=E4MZ26_KITSK|nr:MULTISPECIES: helix-turn-helix transcriptional regulator [Kitasatospora]BAJ25919.1 putative DNA-binding protein [Kitasatospora setae KM-6054]BAJ33359.1 putative DNA-binding protein [Kitasatospora setae KM-6054]
MDTPSVLGDFLRSRRARLQPEDVGLRAYGARRRVPGLRREELAQLAGVSVTHYTRLEQGQSTNASDAVLDAIARALRLNTDETAHLRDLARPAAPARPAPLRPDYARPAAAQLIAAMTDVPAVILDRRNDVLAWNPLGHALLAGHIDYTAPQSPSERPNLTRMLFLDEHTRELHTAWEDEAKTSVAALRLTAGRHPDDRRLAELIGQLAMKSDEFAGMWSRHPVRSCTFGTKLLHHPFVGALELSFESMQLADDSGQRMLAYSAPAGSPSQAGLQLLAGTLLSHPPHGARPAARGHLAGEKPRDR